MANVPWIDDSPDLWETVTITPNGSKKGYEFLCRWRGAHNTKIDQSQAIDRPGDRKRLAGLKAARIEFDIILFNDQDRTLYTEDSCGLVRYTALKKALRGAAVGGKLLRHSVDHPAMKVEGIRSALFYARGTLLQKNESTGEMVSTLTFLEDLPPGKQEAQTGSGAPTQRQYVENQSELPSTLGGVFQATPQVPGGGVAISPFTSDSGQTAVDVTIVNPSQDRSVIGP